MVDLVIVLPALWHHARSRISRVDCTSQRVKELFVINDFHQAGQCFYAGLSVLEHFAETGFLTGSAVNHAVALVLGHAIASGRVVETSAESAIRSNLVPAWRGEL
jgi:hypothetical protein